jgi:hypothetical protein
MKPEGKRLEHLITDQVSEGHQRTVVISLPFQSLKGPNGRGENFVHVPEGVHIRALFDLKVVVVHEAVQQRVAVNQQSEK